MNNEPVAWMYQDDESRSVAFYQDTLPCGAVPLYTHPADLTDEEIKEVLYKWDKNGGTTSDASMVNFAKAILRKAQEK